MLSDACLGMRERGHPTRPQVSGDAQEPLLPSSNRLALPPIGWSTPLDLVDRRPRSPAWSFCMPAHVRHRHRRPQPIVSRPTTVLALGLAVSALSVTALVHTPAQAQATETSNSASGDSLTTDNPGAQTSAPPSQSFGDSRLVRVVANRQQQIAQKEALEARRLRQERRERKLAARGAPRTSRSGASFSSRGSAGTAVRDARSGSRLVGIVRRSRFDVEQRVPHRSRLHGSSRDARARRFRRHDHISHVE